MKNPFEPSPAMRAVFGRRQRRRQHTAIETGFFELRSPSRVWGDYGSVLYDGMAAHLPHHDGMLSLERTAQGMNPITFPYPAPVFTQQGRQVLERIGVSNVAFHPVHPARIVDYDWTGWDLTAKYPSELPEEGEPENYILTRPHRQDLADALGSLWQMMPTGCKDGDISSGSSMCPSELTRLDSVKTGIESVRSQLESGLDVWMSRADVGEGKVIVSERIRDQLVEEFGEAIVVTPFTAYVFLE